MRRLAGVAAGLACTLAAHAQAPFSFGVIGDAPYFDFEVAPFIGTLRALGETGVAFVVHVGDLKSGWSPCTDALLKERRDMLDDSAVPLVYTPGDNEWSDCRRTGSDPLERLAALRTLFFARPESLGRRRIALAQQQGRPENVRWRYGGVVFATINVPGGHNNRDMPDEHRERMRDNLAWLDEAVAQARASEGRGLVVVMQGDPSYGSRRDSGYAELRAALGVRAQRLAKPMLLVHGDGHKYRFDRPTPAGNFQRLETMGSPLVGGVIVKVDPSGTPRFSAEPFSLGTADR